MKAKNALLGILCLVLIGLTFLIPQIDQAINTTTQTVEVSPAFQTHPPDAMTNEAYQVNVLSAQVPQQISAQIKVEQLLTTQTVLVGTRIAAQNQKMKNNAAYNVRASNTWYDFTMTSPATFYDDAVNTTLKDAYNYQISARYMISPAVYNANAAVNTTIQNSAILDAFNEEANISATVMLAKALQNGNALAITKKNAIEATIINLKV